MALPPAHATKLKVYYYDTDAGGVVHNVAYLRLIEAARTDYAEVLGWTVKEMGASGETWAPATGTTNTPATAERERRPASLSPHNRDHTQATQ